jgi:hypothetical protein
MGKEAFTTIHGNEFSTPQWLFDSLNKEFNISSILNWDKIKKELEKCVLLCANCHREVHDGLHPEYLALDDKDKYYL